jgi:hypothetical protein
VRYQALWEKFAQDHREMFRLHLRHDPDMIPISDAVLDRALQLMQRKLLYAWRQAELPESWEEMNAVHMSVIAITSLELKAMYEQLAIELN